MDISAYRLLYDNIHDFKTTALYVEAEIKRYGIRDDCHDEVSSMKGRTHHDMWVSMKTVSHFNLGIALELMLKLLLFLNKKPIPRDHHLVQLHDAIPEKYQKSLESAYQDSRTVMSGGYELIAFLNTASPTDTTRPPDRDISTLRGIFEYFDQDLMLWQKRYSWELIENGLLRHYISDISVFAEFINRVMRDIPRDLR